MDRCTYKLQGCLRIEYPGSDRSKPFKPVATERSRSPSPASPPLQTIHTRPTGCRDDGAPRQGAAHGHEPGRVVRRHGGGGRDAQVRERSASLTECVLSAHCGVDVVCVCAIVETLASKAFT